MNARKTPPAKGGKAKKAAKPSKATSRRTTKVAAAAKVSKAKTLTPKQQRFVDEYLVDMNGTQAAIRSGYSVKTAGSQANWLLKNPNVAREVEKRLARVAEKLEVTKEMIVDELRKIAFADLRKAVAWGPTQCTSTDDDGQRVVTNGVTLVDSSELDDDTAAAVAEVGNTRDGVKIKLHDKKGALVDLAKMLGFMTDKVELTGKDGGAIVTRTENMTPEQRREEIQRLLAENPALIQHLPK